MRKDPARRSERLLPFTVIAGVLAAMSCGGGDTTAPPPPPPPPPPPVATALTIAPAAVTLSALGETSQFSAEVRDQTGRVMAGAPVRWASSDPAVATVDGTGLVTAVGNGEANVTAASGSATGSAAVTVSQRAAEVRVTPAELGFTAAGDTARLAAEVLDANGHPVATAPAVRWASSDPAVATVDDTGLVTAVGNGEASVTAASGSATGSAAVTVSQRAAEVRVTPAELGFTAAGDTARLAAEVLDANGHPVPAAPAVRWASSDPAVATVDGTGLVTAVGNGEANVTGASGSATGSAAVTVSQRAAEVRVTPAEVELTPAGDTVRLAVEVFDANGHPVPAPAVRWASSDPAVATVDGTGLVTSAAVGETQITATVDSVTASARVKVTSPDPERNVLEAFYEATGGATWTDNTNWLSNAPLDEWFGVTERAGFVVSLRLGDNNLAGSIPPELAGLDSLAILDLPENSLTGEIPPELGLTALRDINLGGNDLTGSIPPELGELEALYFLNLGGNSLTGEIPPELGRLTALRDLLLRHNRLSGPLPEELGDLATLDYVSLVNNEDLTGPLPLSFARLTLSSFSASGTALCLPPELEEWYAAIPSHTAMDVCHPPSSDRETLVSFYREMGGENWSDQGGWLGPRPAGHWRGVTVNAEGRVTELRLPRNNLTGPLSLAVTKLPALTELALFGNAITGQIPPELEALTELTYLSLGENRLSGPVPPELGNLRKLVALYLSHNGLTGSIPRELGQLSELEILWLHNNRLTGDLPPPGRLVKLKELSLTDNRLSGAIPPEWGTATALERLAIGRNDLTGSIPPELGQLRNLQFLWLFGNRLTGPIPPELGNLRQLENLSLSQNQLSGPIPPELGNAMSGIARGWPRDAAAGAMRRGREPEGSAGLDGAKVITLRNNQLTGPLPPEIGGIPGLEVLWLHGNAELTGLLPRDLMQLRAMQELTLDGTGLCPPLDRTFQSWLSGVDVLRVDPACTPAHTDRLALEQLLADTNGDGWANADGWGTDRALGEWHGVGFADGRVRELDLSGNGLAGAVSLVVGSLTGLERLDLSDNRLAGALPPDLASLVRLRALNVSGNEDLTGRIPFELTSLRLQSLLYNGTGICAPPSSVFQSWLAGIDNVTGATCDNVAAVRLSIPFATITQSIQRPENDVALVAGRDALLRAFLVSDVPGAYYEPRMRASLRLNGREIWASTIVSGSDQIPTEPDQSSLERSFNATIPGEHIRSGIELVLEADPDGVVPEAAGSAPRHQDRGIVVRDVPPMDVTLVPVLELTRPDSSVLEWVTDADGALGFFRQVFPVGEMRASHRASFVTSLNLANSSSSWSLLLDLEAARLIEGAGGYWYGAGLSRRGYFRGVARLAGPVAVGKPWDTETAHELGHLLNLVHAPCGSPDWIDPNFPHPGGGIGAWGFDFRTESLVSPLNRRDIMGYCYEASWISDYHYERVLDYRAPAGPGPVAGPPRESLILRGGVLDGELRLATPFVIDAPPQLPQQGGEYRLEVWGPDGSTWFSRAFTPGEDSFGNRYFVFSVPLEGNSAARVVLLGPEGSVAVDGVDRRAVTVVWDPDTRQVRGILRDWAGPLPSVFPGAASLDAIITRGLVLERDGR